MGDTGRWGGGRGGQGEVKAKVIRKHFGKKESEKRNGHGDGQSILRR